jgi:tetratricopeptide (TPR) repeat protein
LAFRREQWTGNGKRPRRGCIESFGRLDVVTPERWKEIEAVFEQALEVSEAERATFLQHKCNGDAELLREVQSLLDSHAEAGSFIDKRSLFFSGESFDEVASAVAPGQLIGQYRVVRELGRGGMGAVYLAERADQQYEKRVAIKLIKRGMDTDSVLRHFRNERQILASFDHPNIGRLFDGGTTADGLPYFVMEYVEGIPIDQCCQQQELSVAERLKLFRDVCAAVIYAHRHTVIHRDIKPSNILVTRDRVPKLLDFGIAKILQSGDGAEPLMTAAGVRPMTPEYASPEQVRGEAVTTATDVYSLGVVLYELLTGTLPYRFTTRSAEEVQRAITEQNAERPSTAAAAAGAKSKIENRKSLRGDIDNIVLMTLRKEPERRYQSVDQLSEDIRRHLENRPVLARKDAIGYRAAKFIQRNKVGVAAALLIVVSLVAGLIATTWQAHRARVEKGRAERRFNDVRRLAHSVLFDYHDAIKDLPGATRVRERLVKDALAYLDSLAGETSGDPALQRELAAAYERVGDVRGQAYSANLGDRAGAMDSYQKALRIREALVIAAPREVQSRRDLAAIHEKIGNKVVDTNEAARGLEHLRKSLALYSELAAEHAADRGLRRDLAEIYDNLGGALEGRGKIPAALEHHRKARSIYEELLAANPHDRAIRRSISVSYEDIGRALFLSNDAAGALENNQKALALREALVSEEPTNADYRRILGISYQNNGDYRAWTKDNKSALESFRKKLALDEQSVAADPANAQGRTDLAYCCLRMGDLLAQLSDQSQAVPYYRRALEIYETTAAADSQDLNMRLNAIRARAKLATAHAKLGNLEPAREECRKTADLLEATVDDPANADLRRSRVLAYGDLGEAHAILAAHKRTPRHLTNQYWRRARDMYQRSLNIMKELRDRGILDAEEIPEIEKTIGKIAECDTALAGLE